MPPMLVGAAALYLHFPHDATGGLYSARTASCTL